MSKPEAKKSDRSISLKCRECLVTLTFSIPSTAIEAGQFPIKLEKVHGEPAHNLIIFVNKKLEVESFEIKEVLPEKGPDSIGMLGAVLGDIGLTQKETQLYFRCTRLGPVAVGEMAILIDSPADEVEEMAKKFVTKGLFKEIAGVTKYFQALPPYAALLTQLQKFGGFISSIKDETPRELQRSFSTFEQSTKGVQNLKEFVAYLTSIKEDVSTKLSNQKQALEGTLGQLKNQQEIIPSITMLRDQSSRLLDNQVQSLDQHLVKNEAMLDRQLSTIENQLGNIQDKIARNLEKLHLGVVSQTVQDLTKKIIQGEIAAIRQNFQTEIKVPYRQMMENFKKTFQNEFGAPFRTLLAQLSSKIQGVSTDAGKIDDDLRNLFSSLITQFDATLTDASTRIQGISDSVMGGVGELRNAFGQNVIVTLDDVLGKVLTRLNMSTKTIEEFWEEARRVVRVSAKDIWFVRTPEGMKAQIIDAVSRAKMRVLIIAPTLAEVDVHSLLQAPKFINIRIAALLNPEDPKHKQILDALATRPNISVRQWDLQNLWAINRDYEEVIVGIVSKNVSGEGGAFDVAGIGSTLQEHIKIFTGIIEDAWMGARKDIGYIAPAVPTTSVAVSSPIPSTAPKRREPAVSHAGPGQGSLKPAPEQASEKSALESAPAKTISPARQPDEQEKPPKPRSAPVRSFERSRETPTSASAAGKGTTMPDIIGQVDAFASKIDPSTSAADLARDLEGLRDFVFEKKGFHTILHDMKNVIGSLRHEANWDAAAKDTMHKRVESWKEKLLS